MPASARARRKKVALILSFTNGAGGDRNNVSVVGIGDSSEPVECCNGAVDRRRLEPLHVGAASTEPDRLLLTGEDLGGAAVESAGNDHVNRVGSDIDCGDRWSGVHILHHRSFTPSGKSVHGASPI